jgi:hypothetical protein
MRAKYHLLIIGLLINLLSYSLFAVTQGNHSVLAQSAQPTSPLTRSSAAPVVLPDAVYFLNERGQLARLEADGVQVTLITREAAPVTGFDVSPDGQQLAYISANSLIESDAFGENRVVKVQGASFDPTDPQQTITLRLGPVLYTPDGKAITFGLNGINWIASGANSGDAQVLLANDPYPAPNQPGPTRFVWPTAWSPDGQRLLLNYVYHASDDMGRSVLDLTTGAERPVCRSAVWGRDSQSLFCIAQTYAQEMGMRLEIGRVDAATGAERVVVQGVPTDPAAGDQPYRLFRTVYALADGTLLAFGDQWTTPPPIDGPVSFYAVQRYTFQRISADGSQITPLRRDRYRLTGDLLWAADGSGVLISDATTSEAGRQAAPLLWLPSDGSPAVELFAIGHQMQWRTRLVAAKPTPLTGSALTIAPTPAATVPATILQVLNVRSGPGTQFAMLGQLAVGAAVQVTGRTADGSERWWQIVYPQGAAGRAWINGNPALVQVTAAASIPVVATPANQ